MNNLIRKEIRLIVDKLGQLSKACTSLYEEAEIEKARVSLVCADYHDFHLNPKKKYVVPKTSFKYSVK